MSAPFEIGEASETAWVLAEIACAMEEKDRNDLLRLLDREITALGGYRERWRRLGLLVMMVDETGQMVPTKAFDKARDAAAALGVHFPERSTAASAYGGWLPLNVAAVRFSHLGTAGRVPRSLDHARIHPPSTHRAVAEGLHRAHDFFGRWPYEAEFHEWAQWTRRVARLAGQPFPLLPGLPQIRKLFGDYPAAIHYSVSEKGIRPEDC